MSVKTPPRLAIIGCGTVVEFGLVAALRRIRWLPSVLVDTSSARMDVIELKIGRKRKNIIRASDWKSVEQEFDAALVALPSALHGSIGNALVGSGKHVFMEKPLATTADECSRMVAAAEGSGVALSVGLLRRYLSVARWTKALIASGTLGEIKKFEIREGRVIDTDANWDARFRPNIAGGGVLMEMGAHVVDQLIWWLGDVRSVSYRDDSEGGSEADCVMECRLTSGATGRVVLSRTRNLRNSISIQGTCGCIEVHLYKNEIFGGSANALGFRSNGIGVSKMKPQFAAELFDAELGDFNIDVCRRAGVAVSARDSAKSIDVIERCYRAREPLAYPWTVSAREQKLEGAAPGLPPGSKVLVTGGRGFIGGRLIEQLVQQHAACVRAIIRDAGRPPRAARFPIDLIRGDLTNPDDVDRAVQGMDYVLHCAYDTKSRRQNIDGLRALIEACAKHSVRRLVHISTFAVYEPFPDGPLREDTQDGDRSIVYVDTKLELEKIVFNFARDCGVPATIIQPSVVYGPYSKPWTDVPAERLIFGEVKLPDCGDGLCNAIFIDDLIDGIVLATLSSEAVGERFILSGPRPTTWAKFFGEFARVLGTKPPKYFPRDSISKTNSSLLQNIRGAFSNPKQIVKLIAGGDKGRAILQSWLDVMPIRLQTIIMNNYFHNNRHPAGGLCLLSPQLVAFYSSKAIAGCEKARTRLGYSPRFDFQSGMALTSEYLKWAYGDQQRVVPGRAIGAS
jgi:predicted dehydrogenase/nucleoside-diphosphate-sugar epimerase